MGRATQNPSSEQMNGEDKQTSIILLRCIMSNRKVTTKTIQFVRKMSTTKTCREIAKLLRYKPETLYNIAHRFGIKFTSKRCKYSSSVINRIFLLKDEQKLTWYEVSLATGLTVNVCNYLYRKQKQCDRHPSSTTR